MKLVLSAAFLVGVSSGSLNAAVPADILRQVPDGYAVITFAQSSVSGRTFYFVALRSEKELHSRSYLSRPDQAPPRPLLIYERTGGSVMLIGRNDHVIDRADDAGLAGNGCDPFEGGHIVVKDNYFTVENGVSCGAHWTDYVTFRFEPRVGYIFDNWRFTSWKLNPSDDPNAEALVPDVQNVVQASKDCVVPFSKWRRP